MSSLKAEVLVREFRYNGIRISDPGPELIVEQVRDLVTRRSQWPLGCDHRVQRARISEDPSGDRGSRTEPPGLGAASYWTLTYALCRVMPFRVLIEHLARARRGPPSGHAVALGQHIFREDLGRGRARTSLRLTCERRGRRHCQAPSPAYILVADRAPKFLVRPSRVDALIMPDKSPIKICLTAGFVCSFVSVPMLSDAIRILKLS